MQLTYNKKGFTLIEIIVSIAILGIIVVAFCTMFSNGLISLFISGHKTDATAKAQEYMDRVWDACNNGTIQVADPDAGLKTILGENYCSDTSKLYTAEGKSLKYYYTTTDNIGGENYTNLTIVVFYQNGTRYVTLTSVIPVGGF